MSKRKTREGETVTVTSKYEGHPFNQGDKVRLMYLTQERTEYNEYFAENLKTPQSTQIGYKRGFLREGIDFE